MSIKHKIFNRLGLLIKQSAWAESQFPDCSKFWNHNTFDLDVVNLGSTNAKYAFDYTSLGYKTANWAMSPQTLLQDYEILRNYFCYIRKGGYVILPLCPFSSLGGGYTYFPDKYYTILNISSIPGASFIKQQEVFNRRTNLIYNYPLVQLPKLFSKPRESGCNSLAIDAQTRIQNWKHEFSIDKLDAELSLVNRDSFIEGVKILSNTISFCKSRDLIPVLVLPPVSSDLRAFFTHPVMQKYVYNFVNAIDIEGVQFLDYFMDSTFSDKYFLDSFRLNSEGAKLFTSIVIKQLYL